MQKIKAIGPFKQVLTLADLPDRGPIEDIQLKPHSNTAFLIQNGKIIKIDAFEKIAKETAENQNIEWDYVDDDCVAVPSFTDAHTHICFAGSRAGDYAMRTAGKSYQEIAAAGGGIWDTVEKTRKAGRETLTQLIIERCHQLLQNGITTVEVKSGYGLSVDTELMILRAINDAAHRAPVKMISTCLPAHIVPRDFDGGALDYISLLLTAFFPKVQKEGLSDRVDIFVEKGAFSVGEASMYLRETKKMGFYQTIHADQFSTGGSELAVQFGVISADHLEASGDREIELLAKSQVIPIALPGASIGLGMNFAPARKLLDAGAPLAIASDWNPGSAPMGDLLTQCSLLSIYEKLTTAEIFAGITFRAAAALALQDRGRFRKGMVADIVAFPTDDYREILYHQGRLRPVRVWKNGENQLLKKNAG